MVIFVGIDPGLTAPAVCVMDPAGEVLTVRTIRTGRLRGQERVEAILQGVDDVLFEHVYMWDAVASIEAYAFSKRTQGQNATVEAVGALKHYLWRRVPFIQSIGPMTLKKYITGDGKADKREMIAAASRSGVDVIDDNQADAWGLAVILRDAYEFAALGVQPSSLYRYEVCNGLRPWIEEQTEKGASA